MYRVHLPGIHVTWLFDSVPSKCLLRALPMPYSTDRRKETFTFFFFSSWQPVLFISRGKVCSLPSVSWELGISHQPPLYLEGPTQWGAQSSEHMCVQGHPARLLLWKVQLQLSFLFSKIRTSLCLCAEVTMTRQVGKRVLTHCQGTSSTMALQIQGTVDTPLRRVTWGRKGDNCHSHCFHWRERYCFIWAKTEAQEGLSRVGTPSSADRPSVDRPQ